MQPLSLFFRTMMFGHAPILIAVAMATNAGAAEVGASSGAGPGAASTPKNSASWIQKMKALETALNHLLFDISNDERFENKKNFKAIEANAVRFAKLAHSVSGKMAGAPDADQSLQLIGSDFSREADAAVKSLKAGHRAYARVILSSMTSYCVACHTRTNTGSSFAGLKGDPRLEKLPPFTKGNYLIAVREFDRALGEFQKIADDESAASGRIYDYERSLRYGLSVAVRVKRDPDLALKLVDAVGGNPKAPYFLKAQAQEWKKSILEWKAEKPVRDADAQKLFNEATRLVAKARGIQKFPADRSADILYLRASGILHELLGLAPKGEPASKALYLAGLSYDVLSDYGIRDFSEFYYRSCIRTTPHTEIAQECYRRYEESVYFGYTGSGGTYIPSDVRARLNELELLSTPEPDLKTKSRELQ